MNIKEICEKASHKDLLECEIFGDKQEFILWFNQILTRDKRLPVFISDHFKTNTWQIIPARKEPMGYEEWYKKFNYLALSKSDSKECWQASEENRDLLYTGLIARVNEFINVTIPNVMNPDGIDNWRRYFKLALVRIEQHKEQDGNK